MAGAPSLLLGVDEEERTVCDSVALSVSRMLQNFTDPDRKRHVFALLNAESCADFRSRFGERLERRLNGEKRKSTANGAKKLPQTCRDAIVDSQQSAAGDRLYSSVPLDSRVLNSVELRKTASVADPVLNDFSGSNTSVAGELCSLFSGVGDRHEMTKSLPNAFSNVDVNEKDFSAAVSPAPSAFSKEQEPFSAVVSPPPSAFSEEQEPFSAVASSVPSAFSNEPPETGVNDTEPPPHDDNSRCDHHASFFSDQSDDAPIDLLDSFDSSDHFSSPESETELTVPFEASHLEQCQDDDNDRNEHALTFELDPPNDTSSPVKKIGRL